MVTRDVYNSAIMHIASDKTEKAIELLLNIVEEKNDFYKGLVLLSSQLASWKKSAELNLPYSVSTINDIRYRLLNIIEELKESEEAIYSAPVRKEDPSIRSMEIFKKLNIDAGVLTEAKRVVNPHLALYSTNHEITIWEADIDVKVTHHGFNASNSPCSYFSINTAASNPSTFKEMSLEATDLINEKPMRLFSNNFDRNMYKELKYFFLKPLKSKDEFKAQFSYRLKNSISTNGIGYLHSIIPFQKQVDKFDLILNFKFKPPEYIELNNINEDLIQILYPIEMGNGTSKFHYQLTSSDTDYLNNLRVLITFIR